MRPAVALSVSVFIATGASATEPAAGTTAKELMARIDTEGGKKVSSELWENEQAFDALLAPVEAGDPEWFKVWIALRAHSDAAISESIDMSFARAIPKTPEAVLRLVGRGLELDDICGSPFIEPDPGVAEEYERKAQAALSKVRDPELKSLAKECAARVRLGP